MTPEEPPLNQRLSVFAEFNPRGPVPDYLVNGLRPDFDLRPYQTTALVDYTRLWDWEQLSRFRFKTLFHMATGSGKTLMMAGLMLYLYKQGYRDFVFFVNSTNVLEKTRDNFLNPSSPKFLFAEHIRIDGHDVTIREVENFHFSDPDGINIRFTTIQGLHMDLATPREGRMTFEDFEERRVVLISDEAHHINAITRQGITRDEERDERSWETTIERVVASHPDNLLLEFTATMDLQNQTINAKYRDRIVVDYDLKEFRREGYSKEIQLLQADLPPLERSLQAMVVSQHRLKLFQDNALAIKPVVMFKSKSIRASAVFFEEFADALEALSGATLTALREQSTSEVVERAFSYFEEHGITPDALASELRLEFGESRRIVIDSQNISPEVQLAVNSLESNHYRAVFAVDMLNEGWDVLNLFDIVRLHDNRDARGGRPGRSTMTEAQLIGRGARYCPFALPDQPEKYRRKFDEDLTNPLRSCEELYFHSATNSRYIDELRTALIQTGALPDEVKRVDYRLKESFKASDVYKTGWVFANRRVERRRDDIDHLPDAIRFREFTLRETTGASRMGAAFGEDVEKSVKVSQSTRELKELSPAVLDTALRGNEQLRFDRLRRVLPNLTSLREFGTSDAYLGSVRLILQTREDEPTPGQWLRVARRALTKIADDIRRLKSEHFGSTEFLPEPLREIITDRTCYIADPKPDGVGTAQRDASDPLRLNLSGLDWYGQEENYGTTEEKRFLVYFNGIVDQLRQTYDLVLMLRNEGQVVIHDFDTGAPFQPDFLLLLHRPSGEGYEQFQVFVEPKGAHLVDKDRWKEQLLLSLEAKAVAVKRFADDNEYRVWGLPFYTHEPAPELRKFTDAMGRLEAGSPPSHPPQPSAAATREDRA